MINITETELECIRTVFELIDKATCNLPRHLVNEFKRLGLDDNELIGFLALMKKSDWL